MTLSTSCPDTSAVALNRREMAQATIYTLGMLACAPLLARPASAQGHASHAAEQAFLKAYGGILNVEARLALLDDAALIVVHDLPFPLDKTGYADHLAFHSGQWEKLALIPSAIESRAYGDTVIVSAYFNERGKPKNAGFRLRPGFMTATLYPAGKAWRIIALHSSPLRAQLLDASPS